MMGKKYRRIYGVTVGTTMPKPNLMQDDPTKGDYVKGKEEFLKNVNTGNGEVPALEGYLKASELPEAINTALAQAKASGEFDGADGKDGKDGQDGYTPQKGVDYFDGKDGTPGNNGKDGASPVVSVSAITGGHRITITDKNGTKTVDVLDGVDGQNGTKGNGIKSAVLNADYTLKLTFDDGTSYTTPSIRGATGATGGTGATGKDGTSVTVKSISESSADGGSNVITFSDGKTITIKNGKTGSQGPAGNDYVLTDADKTAIAEQAAQIVEVPEVGSGTRGPGILQVSTTPSAYTTATGGQTPTKRMKLSTIMSEASVSEVMPGDAIRHSYYLYPIYYVDATYAYTKSGTSIRGASGAKGSTGAAGADGYTPVKYVDYWTEADQEDIVQQAVNTLGNAVYGVVDANNNIVFRGYLANGAYTLKYEDADGNTVDGGTITVSSNESGSGSGGNDSGMGDSGSIPLTWSIGVKLDKNTGAEGSGSGYAASSHVELVDGYAYTVTKEDNSYGNTYGGLNVVYYDASGNGLGSEQITTSDTASPQSKTITPVSGAKTFRVRAYCGSETEGYVKKYYTVTYNKV